MRAFLVLLLLLPWTVSADQEPRAEVRITLRPKSEPKAPLAGFVALRPANGKGEGLRLPVASGPLVASLPATSAQWILSAEIPGYWAGQEVISPNRDRSPSVLSLVLWPTGKLAGSFKMQDPGQKLPESFEVRMESPPVRSGGRETPKGAVICPVGEKGAWTCEIPAGILDTALRVPGFIPHYRWGLKVRTGEKLELGTLILKKGASLAGWVEVEGGALEAGKCLARLSPLLAPGHGNPSLDTRLRGAALEQAVSKQGFFQLEGIAPGTYQIEVRQPGFAPARAFPIEVWERSETALGQPLVLRRPLTLELSISPPLDWLDRPWKVFLQRRSDFSAGVEPDSVVESAADRQGRLRIEGQTPGRFRLDVSDSQGNGFFSDADFRIEGPEDARQVIEIKLVSLQGKVSLGDEPLEADLWFGGRFGSVRSRLESDAEGEFLGVLPREGSWKVQIQARNPPLDTHAKVEVKARANGEAKVEIVLPDTLVFGKVLDEGGRPVREARVSLNTLIDHGETRTAEDGAFEFRALPAGRVKLTAEASSPEGPLTSDEVLVEAADSRPAGPVSLVLHKTKTFSGRIRSSRGPVAGAMVFVQALRPAAGQTGSARTGLDGRFSLKIPGKAERLAVVVSAPGGALKAFQIPAIEDPVVLQVTEEAGNLEITLPFTVEEAGEKGLGLAIFQDGIHLSPSVLYRWSAGHGVPHIVPSGLQVPRVAPGEYEACLGPAAMTEAGEIADWKSQSATCVSGHVGVGSTLNLDLREAPRSPAAFRDRP